MKLLNVYLFHNKLMEPIIFTIKYFFFSLNQLNDMIIDINI